MYLKEWTEDILSFKNVFLEELFDSGVIRDLWWVRTFGVLFVLVGRHDDSIIYLQELN